MPVTVAADLVAAINNLAHEPGKVFADPAQYEEGSLHAALIEQIEQAIGIGDDAAGDDAPIVATDAFIKRADLVVIFHIDGQNVEHFTGHELTPLHAT